MMIYSGRPSDGAKALANELGIRRAKETGRTLPAGTLLINWGNTILPNRFRNCDVINKPEDIKLVSNKLDFFWHLDRNDCDDILPIWFNEKEEAAIQIEDHRCKIVCRKVLNGSGGAGIVIASTPNELVDAPLYVEYIKKKYEYRVHVFNGNVIHVQQKRRRHGNNPSLIRNLANGYIYACNDVNAPVCVTQVAERCMENLDLHFGAVDVIWRERDNKAYVLEVNSAPGLEGTTVKKYAEYIREEYM